MSFCWIYLAEKSLFDLLPSDLITYILCAVSSTLFINSVLLLNPSLKLNETFFYGVKQRHNIYKKKKRMPLLLNYH